MTSLIPTIHQDYSQLLPRSFQTSAVIASDLALLNFHPANFMILFLTRCSYWLGSDFINIIMFKCRTAQADGRLSHRRGSRGSSMKERMSHCEKVVPVLTLATSRRTSVKSVLKGEQPMKLCNKDKKKKSSLLTWFKISFQPFFRTLLSLPPNYTALLTTSYSRWLWVLIKYSYIIRIRQKRQRWQNCFSQKKPKQNKQILSDARFTFYTLVT